MFNKEELAIYVSVDDLFTFSTHDYWKDTEGNYWKVKYVNVFNYRITLEKVGWFKSLLIKWGWI